MSGFESNNNSMLKVSEFAQLAQITVKTLHHYDNIGLLQPATVDPFTNYRYYTVEQLPRIHRIMALRELGLSLEQIAIMLDEEVSADEIRGMLALRRAEALQKMREAKRQLSMIEFHLNMIDAETEFPQLDVLIKRLEPMRFLSFYAPAHPSYEAGLQHLRTTAQTINRAIADGTIKHTGVGIDVFHGQTMMSFADPGLGSRQHEILLGVAADQEPVTLDGIGPLTIKEEPAVAEAATIMLDGPQHQHLERVTLMRRWALDHGYRYASLVRYLNHKGPLQTSDPGEFLAEAQLPLEKV
ncbi:MAG: MerR family transcriptional regulator [Candidatus Promineifilaceae bacterium]|jgi:DNA-binding transcriptional MerR regulator